MNLTNKMFSKKMLAFEFQNRRAEYASHSAMTQFNFFAVRLIKQVGKVLNAHLKRRLCMRKRCDTMRFQIHMTNIKFSAAVKEIYQYLNHASSFGSVNLL